VGEWQRIALARTFWRDAWLVILDEPTSSMDAEAEARFWEELRPALLGRAALLISHRFSTVRQADRIYVMAGGRVVEEGRHEDLVSLGGRYAHLSPQGIYQRALLLPEGVLLLCLRTPLASHSETRLIRGGWTRPARPGGAAGLTLLVHRHWPGADVGPVLDRWPRAGHIRPQHDAAAGWRPAPDLERRAAGPW
jgi:hypothetical protein